MTMITGQDNIEAFRIMTLARALALEIVTGMQRSRRGRSTLALVKDLGFQGRTRKEALRWVIDEYNLEVSASLQKALDS